MFWRRRARLDEEIDAHLAEETADNVARGMDPSSARRAALRTFGNVGAAKERARELDPLYWLDTTWQDVRFACRLITRTPWISAAVVATLTIGISLNVSVFGLVSAMFLRPWVSAPETFVAVVPKFSGKYSLRFSDGGLPQPDYVFYRDSAASLEALGAYRLQVMTLSGTESGSVPGALMSCNMFDVLQPGPPLAGRYLTQDDCASPGGAPVAVLGEGAWRSTFGADPGAIGRVIHLNRVPHTVVGIVPRLTLPAGALGAEMAPHVWVPYTMLGALRRDDDYFADHAAQWLSIVGRRRAGYSIEQTQQELDRLSRQADERVPGRATQLVVTDGSLVQEPERGGRVRLILSMTLGTTTLLLLLACANVTTLLLSRSAARQREIAVRLSLGAGRFRLLRQLLTESLVLSGIAAVFSFVVALRAPAALWQSVMAHPAPFDLMPDWRVLVFCVVLAILAGATAGLSPAAETLRPELTDSLKTGNIAATAGPRRSRLRSTLVAVQIALGLLLLVQAGLFTRAQHRFFAYDPGFETKQVLRVRLASVGAGFEPPASFYRDLESRVTAVPGVLHVSYASLSPWFGRNSTRFADIDGVPLPDTRDFRRDPARRIVSPQYFAVLGLPVTRGRTFRPDERPVEGQPMPVVISEAMARRYWPDRDPVGRRFRTSVVHEVIGVCPDVQSVRFMQDDGPFYYPLLDPDRAKPAHMLLRVAGDTRPAAAAVREIVRQLDPQMAFTVEPLASLVETEGNRLQPIKHYGSAAAVLALLLALTGVYGVVSFSVSQRVREIGIRMALGASRREVVSLVLRSGAAPIVLGLVAGLALALLASSAVEAVVVGFNPRDPLTLTAVPLLLLAAALCAIWIPARRASRTDPLTSLRRE